MKFPNKAMIVVILWVMIVPQQAAMAQMVTPNRVFARSGRYSLELPQGWVATRSPAALVQQAFPFESLTLASSKSALDYAANYPDLDNVAFMTDLARFDEGVIVGSSLAGVFYHQLDFEDFTGYFLEVNVVPLDPDFETRAIESDTLFGARYDFNVEDHHGVIMMVFDHSNNLFLLYGVSDDEHFSQVDSIMDGIMTVSFGDSYLLDPANLTDTADMVAGMLTVNIVPGWWIIGGDEASIISPEFTDLQQIIGFTQTGSLHDLESLMFTALAIENDDLLRELAESEATSAPEQLAEVLDLYSLLRIPVLEGEISYGGYWVSKYGVDGIFLELKYEQEGFEMILVTVEASGATYALIAITGLGNLNAYRELIMATFQTLRRADGS